MNQRFARAGSVVAVMLATAGSAVAGVSAEEAAKLGSTLTPLGAERAANAAGTIPEWKGVYNTPQPGYVAGGRRGDPFAGDKPLYSVTAKNLDQHAEKLSDGVKALFKKYPDTYRVDVYPTRRTGGAPQWVYDNTLKNATRASLANGSAGAKPVNAFGGIPFPIPKKAEEVMWNHMLKWQGESAESEMQAWQVTANGRQVLTAEALSYQQSPYYFKEGSLENFKGVQIMVRIDTQGPPIRAGEAILGYSAIDPKDDLTWMYLTGQRRVRKLPNACCDTPTPATAGLSTFDELQVYAGQLDRFEWTLVGKKEILVPYNTNRTLVPTKAADVLGPRHMNPDHVRWELHRVWVVDASLAPGKRHIVSKSRYYVDEDTWTAVLGERYDGRGQMWKVLFALPVVVPEMPGLTPLMSGFYDLLADSWFVSGLMNEKRKQVSVVPRKPENFFTPAALAGESSR